MMQKAVLCVSPLVPGPELLMHLAGPALLPAKQRGCQPIQSLTQL